MNKQRGMKLLGITFILSSLTTLFSSLVSAQQNNFELLAQSIGKALANGFSSIRIEPALLTSILLGILLWIIIQSIVVKVFNFGESKWSKAGGAAVSLIIVLLTFIYLPKNFIQAIAYQYGALGAAILTVVPFAIMLYYTLVVTKSRFLARVAWIFYTVYYFAIFLFGTLESEVAFDLTSGAWWALNIPYIAAMIAGIFIFFTVGFWRKKAFDEFIESQAQEAVERAEQRNQLRRIQEQEARDLGLRGRS